MNSVSENGILDQKEFANYKQRTVRARFLHQIFLGVGGATVFGLVGTLAKGLLDAAWVAGTISMGPALGLAAIGILGIGCLYVGARFLSQNILLDQDFQAKKIGLAARGVAPTIPVPEQKPTIFPSQESTAPTLDKLDSPQTSVTSERVLQNKIIPITALAEKSRA